MNFSVWENKNIFDVKTSYGLFRLGSEIFRTLLFLRNDNATDVLIGGESVRRNDRPTCAKVEWLITIADIERRT